MQYWSSLKANEDLSTIPHKKNSHSIVMSKWEERLNAQIFHSIGKQESPEENLQLQRQKHAM